ncbi:hypothetical protein BS47DRAFT_1386335 [Hydnum rufescens UP504]|uniref:Uncharacterized protein n=1 Tax=Hydnum rufescens UP504 TaxID=1448309 RepID=A0A9P6AER2_9AGAM|nr:hypothetical protein BS47DRAFT_1386335 [Hydnum rufescens UP504]
MLRVGMDNGWGHQELFLILFGAAAGGFEGNRYRLSQRSKRYDSKAGSGVSGTLEYVETKGYWYNMPEWTILLFSKHHTKAGDTASDDVREMAAPAYESAECAESRLSRRFTEETPPYPAWSRKLVGMSGWGKTILSVFRIRGR